MITYSDNKIRIEIRDDSPSFYISNLAESLTGIIIGQKDDYFYNNKECVNNALEFLRELLPNEEQASRGYAERTRHTGIAN